MFYDIFKTLCDEKGVSVSKACVEMGLSRSIAAKWKNTKTNPSAEVIPKIAKYFNVTTDYLLTGEQKEKSPTKEGEREVDTLSPAFFRLKKGLEPYNISESDADFILTVYKAHIDKNNQEKS